MLKPINAGGSLSLGFTIYGSTAKTVLIRVIGPGLSLVGLTSGTLGDPQLTLYSNSTGAIIATNDNWGGDPALGATMTRVTPGYIITDAVSKDAMLLVTLQPGGYTAKATGNGGSNGLAIVEVYEVP